MTVETAPPNAGRRPRRGQQKPTGSSAPAPSLAPATFWRLRTPIQSGLRRGLVAASIATPLLAWIIVSALGLVDPRFLPTPIAVGAAFAELLSDGVLFSDVAASLGRVLVGFGAAIAVSVPLGIFIGTFPAVAAATEPMIGLLRYMPASAFIPLLIIWLGLGEPSKIALLFIGTVFFNTLMTADVARLVPKALIEASYTLGASRGAVVRKVIVPHVVPGAIDAIRVNAAAAWNFVVVAELVAATSGLGFRIIRAQRFLQTDTIFAVLIVIGLIGVAIDIALRVVRDVAAPWAQAQR